MSMDKEEIVFSVRLWLENKGYMVYETPFFAGRNKRIFGLFDLFVLRKSGRPMLVFVAENEKEEKEMEERIRNFSLRYNIGLDFAIGRKLGRKIKFKEIKEKKEKIVQKQKAFKSKHKQLELF